MRIQYDFNGRFRILAEDGTAGDWAYYQTVATLQHGGKTYIAGTNYGLLPTADTVYELTAIPTQLDHDMEYIDTVTCKVHPKPVKLPNA